MLHANEIVPRNPEPPEPREHALGIPHTSGASLGKGKQSKVKEELESRSEDEDSDSMREKALLVRFRFIYFTVFHWVFSRLKSKESGREDT